MKVSVVTPIYNEAKNIPILFDEIGEVLVGMGVEYEIIGVNDGSRDETFAVLKDLATKDPHVKVINFRVNAGQTAAISAGIEWGTGDVIVLIDSDLENDPHDIPKLIAKMEEGYDVVSGWRQNRWKGSFLSRKLPSMIANWLISKITNVHLHDYGCILKAYRRDVLAGVQLYGEMHRFIPAYAVWRGAKVTEMVVNQRQRIHGQSNYGFGRTFKVVLDLILVRFLDKFMNKPMHFFGGLGFVSLILGTALGILSVFLKMMALRDFVATPLPVWSALLIIVGIQMAAIGVLAEILMRTYYESQGKKSYIIKETINF